MTKLNIHGLLVVVIGLLAAPAAWGHSVGQVQTAKRISQSTVVLLDPQGNPTPGGMGTDTKAQIGDILTFVIQFTPVPNGATRGAGGYITEYIPANTEVVGARIIDASGGTVTPQRGPQMDDGYGPRGRLNELDALGLAQGSLSQVYADTGIFFSTDVRTVRNPANAFISVFNGLAVTPPPTGVGGLGDLLGVFNPPYYAHNEWDRTQAYAFGVDPGLVVANGKGSVPFGFGSAVAGPLTHYQFEKVDNPACSDGIDNDADGPSDYPADVGCASALDDDETAANAAPVGPWQRIRYLGSETGTGLATDCTSCQGGFVRVGTTTDLGWDLTPDNPLPANANAVRFAVGELIVGKEYLAEISLRVTGLPLDPVIMADVNCAEVFGGDAAMPQDGKDNTWRYFLPSPSCVQLNLFFELSVDKLLATPGDTLTYSITGKNLSVNTQNNVVVTDTFLPGDVSFSQAVLGPAPTVAGGTISWPAMNLAPGDSYEFVWEMQVVGNNLSTLSRATYTSMALPAPGFSVVALTTIEPIVVLDQTALVNPTTTTAGSNVHYTGTITNSGTSVSVVNGQSFVAFTLPAGFSYCPPPGCAVPQINGANVADPALGPNNTVVFTQGLQSIAPNGGQMFVDFDVSVGGGVVPGEYTVDMQTTVEDPGIGRDVEISNYGIAPLLVDAIRSDAPMLDSPVLGGATLVTGVTSEGMGAMVVVYVNGNSVVLVVAGAGGVFSAMVPTLYGGQHLNATAQSTGELVSLHSSPDVIVQGVNAVTQCNDGVDNDNDGLIDLADPGCIDGLDPDETDVPQCSDGLDNDNDGFIDFPDDASCSSFLDNDESGLPACGDGVDNDGDGYTDFPDDPGCTDANDVSEADLPQCANFIDDDNDGLIDYPNDPGCDDPYDDDEVDSLGGVGGGGSGGMPAGTAGEGGVSAGGSGNGTPPDLGGVPEAEAVGEDGGCGCHVPNGNAHYNIRWLAMLTLLAGLWVRRQRRQRV